MPPKSDKGGASPAPLPYNPTRKSAVPRQSNLEKHPMRGWLIIPQRRLGVPGLIVLLVAASLVTPLSLDMYTPAVPHMTEYFDTTDAMVNLTMVGYYFFFAIGLLIFGPLSDRYGRKPLLVGGLVVYSAAAALCALSPSIWMLIAARIVQAFGAGAVSSVATAVVKDAFVAEKRETVLSIMQVMFVVGPVAAPVVGAAVLQVASWHMTFWVLAGIGVVCLVMALAYNETLLPEDRFEGTIAGNMKTLVGVAKNKGFSAFLAITAAWNIAFMAYIAVASHIYITFFGLSDLEYSLFFAVAALFTALAPFLWLLCQKVTTARRFVTALIVSSLASGVGMLLFGTFSPFAFCAFFLVFAFFEAAIRPLSTNVLLTQQETDTGAASSLINCAHTVVGSVGMLLAVLPWPNYIVGIAVMIIVTMGAAWVGWIALLRSDIRLAMVKGEAK